MPLAWHLPLPRQANAGVRNAAGDCYAGSGDRGGHADGSRGARDHRKRDRQSSYVCRSAVTARPHRIALDAICRLASRRGGRQHPRRRRPASRAAGAVGTSPARSGAVDIGTRSSGRCAVHLGTGFPGHSAVRTDAGSADGSADRPCTGTRLTASSATHRGRTFQLCPRACRRGCSGERSRCCCRHGAGTHPTSGNPHAHSYAGAAATDTGRQPGRGAKTRRRGTEAWLGSLGTIREPNHA
jgi:hypothetical protein